MDFNTIEIPYQGRDKYGSNSVTSSNNSSSATGGISGGGSAPFMAYATASGDTGGDYHVSTLLQEIQEGTVLKVKLSTSASSEFNTLDLGFPVDADDSGETASKKLIWFDYGVPMTNKHYDINDELTLTYRTSAGTFTNESGVQYTNGWIVDAVAEPKLDEYFTLSATTLITPYNLASSGDVSAFGIGESATSLSVINNLNSDSTVDALSAAMGKALDELKQDLLISGTNIKTINNQSLLGAGNINIEGGGGTTYTAGANIDINGQNVISVTGITSFSGITSGDVVTALGYTPYSNANPSGFTSGYTAGSGINISNQNVISVVGVLTSGETDARYLRKDIGGVVSGYTQFKEGIGLDNNKAIYISDTAGTGIDMMRLGADNSMTIGYGNLQVTPAYPVFIDGAHIYLRTSTGGGVHTLAVDINQLQDALFYGNITSQKEVCCFGGSSGTDIIADLQAQITALEARVRDLEDGQQ